MCLCRVEQEKPRVGRGADGARQMHVAGFFRSTFSVKPQSQAKGLRRYGVLRKHIITERKDQLNHLWTEWFRLMIDWPRLSTEL